MSKNKQPNKTVIKSRLKKLVRGSVEDSPDQLLETEAEKFQIG